MLAREERTLDRLIELYVEQKEASRVEDWPRVAELQARIDGASERLAIIRAGDG